MTVSTIMKSNNIVAEGTMAFHFEKPSGFDFKPGQAIDLILPHEGTASDSQDCRHAFSLVSDPADDELVIATRMRDSKFKHTLGTLAPDTRVEIDGPFGSLTLHKNPTRAGVFITGGIGITPIVSMLGHAAKQQSPQRLVLLYSNRRPEDTAFLTELQQLEQQNPHFHLIATMTDMAHSSQVWDGHTKQIDSDLVKWATEDLPNPIFYITGPPGMVDAMRKTLLDAGVDEDDVRSEEFYGY